MTPFPIVNMYLSPPPVFHHPLSPKSRWYFRPSSLSFTSDNIDSGVGRFYNDIKKEWNNELKKLLIKAPILNKCVNDFCPWKYESVFSSLSFDAAEFRHDEVSLVWAKLFVYKQIFVHFHPDFYFMYNKMYKASCYYLTLYSHRHLWYPVRSRGNHLCCGHC